MYTITLNGERFNLPRPVEVGKAEIVFHIGLDDSLNRFPTARDYIVSGSPFD